jgi:hypothetical protein
MDLNEIQCEGIESIHLGLDKFCEQMAGRPNVTVKLLWFYLHRTDFILFLLQVKV